MAAFIGAIRAAPRLFYEQKKRADDFAERLSPKIGLYLRNDPFGQTTGLEISHAAGGEELPHVQVCVEPLTDLSIDHSTPFITKIEHRVEEENGFAEIIGEARAISWAWNGQTATLSKGRPMRFNIVFYSNASRNLYDVTESERSPNNLLIFYSETAQSGEYRYTIQIEGYNVAPARAFVYVRWRARGYPKVRLEPIGDTVVIAPEPVVFR